MKNQGRIAGGLLALTLATFGQGGVARAEEALTRAAEDKGSKVIKRIVKVRAPAWTAKRGFLGIELLGLNPELRAFFKAPGDRGVLVKRVLPDSPAAKADLRVGDVLIGLDGDKVDSSGDAIRLVSGKPDGHQARLELVRDGKPLSLTAGLEVRERTQVELSKFFHLSQEGDEEELEIDLQPFEDLELPEPPAPPGQHRFIFRRDEGERQQLEQRLKELEEKLRKLEEKLQGRARAPRPAPAPT